MKRKEQWRLMYELFYGTKNTDSIAFVHLLVTGQNPVEGMWEFDPNIGNVVLKSLYSRTLGAPLVRGVDVTQEVIEQKAFKSVELVNGRSLTRCADEGIKNITKVWSFALKYVDSNGNPKLSGDNSFEDIVNRVLDDMWDELNVALPDDEEEDSPKKESTIRLVQI